MKKCRLFRPPWVVVFVFCFVLPVSARGAGVDDEARHVVHSFFTLVHRGSYRDAYDFFSESVKGDVSFRRFREGAQDVRYLKLTGIKIIDREENLIKMKVGARVHLVYKDQLFEADYRGYVDLYRESDKWKVMTVDLEAKSQKPLGKSDNTEKLQKLDFGTN